MEHLDEDCASVDGAPGPFSCRNIEEPMYIPEKKQPGNTFRERMQSKAILKNILWLNGGIYLGQMPPGYISRYNQGFDAKSLPARLRARVQLSTFCDTQRT